MILSTASQEKGLVCPITNKDKGIPIQVNLDKRTVTTGVILCDQAKILDLYKRNAEFIEQAPKEIVLKAIDLINSFIEVEIEDEQTVPTNLSEAFRLTQEEPIIDDTDIIIQ